MNSGFTLYFSICFPAQPAVLKKRNTRMLHLQNITIFFYLCLAYGDTNMYFVTSVIEIFNHRIQQKKGLTSKPNCTLERTYIHINIQPYYKQMLELRTNA